MIAQLLASISIRNYPIFKIQKSLQEFSQTGPNFGEVYFFIQSCRFLKSKIHKPSSLPLTVHCHSGKAKRRVLFCRNCIVHFRLCLKSCVFDRTGRAVRCMLDRDEDMLISGGRHPFLGRYKVWTHVRRIHVVSVLSPETSESSRILWKNISLLISPSAIRPGQMGCSIFPGKVLQKSFWLGWFPFCDLSINNSGFLGTKTLPLLTITLLLEPRPFL